MNNPNKNLFDSFAKNYRVIQDESLNITGANSDYYSEYKIIEVSNKSNISPNGSILDFGCGDGSSLKYFRKHFPSCSLHGIDVSKESIKIAEKLEIDNCQVALFNGLNAPFEDSIFDIVFLANVLHHIPVKHHCKVLIECKRILKIGGSIYIFEHNPFNPVTRKIFKDCIFDKDAEMIYFQTLNKKLKLAGFLKTKKSFYLFSPRHKIFSIFHRLEKHFSFLPIGGQYCLSGRKEIL
jgi:ubiquinone/menaquinone biosynthesis C-methylase UbiE